MAVICKRFHEMNMVNLLPVRTACIRGSKRKVVCIGNLRGMQRPVTFFENARIGGSVKTDRCERRREKNR